MCILNSVSDSKSCEFVPFCYLVIEFLLHFMEITKYGKLDKFKQSIKRFCLWLTGDRKYTSVGVVLNAE